MQIGILGAGHIGGNLTRCFAAVGHDVAVANSRSPETLVPLASETGASAVTAAEVTRGAEVVVVTIPLRVVADLPSDLLDGAAPGVTVIDTNNYYPQRDGRIAPILDGETESRWVAKQLDHTVVKAFNSIYAHNLIDAARRPGAPDRIGLPVAGDDAEAKALVMRLVDEIGFDPVDAGTLDESWRQQPGSPCYGAELSAADLRTALAEASPERPPEFRA